MLCSTSPQILHFSPHSAPDSTKGSAACGNRRRICNTDFSKRGLSYFSSHALRHDIAIKVLRYCSGTKPKRQVPRHNRFAQTRLCSEEPRLVKLATSHIQTPEPERTANSISVWIYGIVADMSLARPPFQPAEYGKTGLKRKRMLSLAQPTWVRQKANISQPSPTNYSCQRLSTHVNFCNAYTPIPWLSPHCEAKERKTAGSFTAWPVRPPLNSWCAAQSSCDGNPLLSPVNPLPLILLILLPNTSQRHRSPCTTPRDIHHRTCHEHTGAPSLPHCAKKDIRLFTELEDMKSTMISLDATFSYNLDCLLVSHFEGYSRETRILLICPSQLLETGSKRRICLPDVPPSSCSKFLSLSRPSHLSYSLFSPLSIPCLLSGWHLSLSKKSHWSLMVLLCQGKMESGFAVATGWLMWTVG